MLVKCNSDITVFILNISVTSTFCLRRECSNLRPTVLLILALCHWCSVFIGTFARLADVWQFPYCICEQPQVLLQTGVFVLNIIVLTINTDLSDTSPVVKRNSYVHLILFNVAAVISATWVTERIAIAFDVVGGTLDAIHVLGVTFFISVYQTVFLCLDCLYYTYAKLKYSSERFRFIDDLRRGEKMIVINI